MTEVFLVFPPVPVLFPEQVQTGTQLILFPSCSGPYGVGPDGNRSAAPVEGVVSDLESLQKRRAVPNDLGALR